MGFPLDTHTQWLQANGCAECRNTGYQGRTGIFEIIPMNEDLRDAIKKEATPVLIKKALRNMGIKTVRQAGIKKASVGITSVSEVLRVT